MEPLSRKFILGGDFLVGFLISIDFIPHNRYPMRTYDTNLVGTSGEELDFEERVFIIDMVKEGEFRLGELGIDWILSRHALTVIRVSSDEGFNHPLIVFHESENDGIIKLPYFPIRHLLLEFSH